MAVNGIVPPVVDEAEVGEIVTEVTEGAGAAVVTVTVADANFVGSALLVAVTLTVPALVGAVNMPAELIVPDDAFQVTDLSVAVPWTAAAN